MDKGIVITKRVFHVLRFLCKCIYSGSPCHASCYVYDSSPSGAMATRHRVGSRSDIDTHHVLVLMSTTTAHALESAANTIPGAVDFTCVLCWTKHSYCIIFKNTLPEISVKTIFINTCSTHESAVLFFATFMLCDDWIMLSMSCNGINRMITTCNIRRKILTFHCVNEMHAFMVYGTNTA